MLSLRELSEQVAAYKDDRLSFAEFENWFEDNSAGAYDVSDLRDACIALDAALSQYHFDHIGEAALKVALENAIHPFVSHFAEAWNVAPMKFAPIHWTVSSAPERYVVMMSTGANQSGPPVQAQVVGSNATTCFDFIPAVI